MIHDLPGICFSSWQAKPPNKGKGGKSGKNRDGKDGKAGKDGKGKQRGKDGKDAGKEGKGKGGSGEWFESLDRTVLVISTSCTVRKS